MTDEEKDKQEFAAWWKTYWDIPRSRFEKDHCEQAYLAAKRRDRERIKNMEEKIKFLETKHGK